MPVAIAGLALLALSLGVVSRAASRLWHLIPIAGLTLFLFPFAAMFLTGDLSRYLPRSMFAHKDQVALASAFASVCVAAILAGCIGGAAATVFQRSRIGGRQR